METHGYSKLRALESHGYGGLSGGAAGRFFTSKGRRHHTQVGIIALYVSGLMGTSP